MQYHLSKIETGAKALPDIKNLSQSLVIIEKSVDKPPIGQEREISKPRSSDNPSDGLINPIDYRLYEILPDPKNPHSLVKPLLERFPFQPPMPAYHPGLDYNHLISHTIKGSPFFIAELYRLDSELAKVMLEAARLKDEEKRYLIRRLKYRLANELYIKEQIENEKNRIRSIFELKAQKAALSRKIHEKLHEKAHSVWSDILLYLYKLRDEEQNERDLAYQKAVLKAHEKKPFDIALSGFNIAQLLAAMKEEKFPSRIISAFKVIEKNALAAYASQILEHIESRSIPSPIFSQALGYIAREEYIENRQEYHSLDQKKQTFNFLEDLKIDRSKLQKELRQDKIKAVEEKITSYWQIFDKNHQAIQTALILSGQNINSINQLLNWQKFSTLFKTGYLITINQNLAHAEQLLSHTKCLIAGLLTPFTNNFIYTKYLMEQDSLTKLFHMKLYLNLIAQIEKFKKIDRHDENLSKKDDIEQRIIDYWHLYDDLHAKINLTLTLNSANVQEMHQLLNDMELSIANHSIEIAKINQLKAHATQVNEHTQSSIPELISFENLKYRSKDHLLSKIKEELDFNRDKIDQLKEDLYSERSELLKEELDEIRKNTQNINLNLANSTTSVQEAKAKYRYVSNPQGLALIENSKENQIESLANQIAEHANIINESALWNNVSPHNSISFSYESELHLTPYASLINTKKNLFSKLLPKASYALDHGIDATPSKQPIHGESELNIVTGSKKKYVIIDTYKENEKSLLHRLTPNIEATLSGFEARYLLNSPTREGMSPPSHEESTKHYPDVVVSFEPMNNKKAK